ncbi:DUF6327 family protein [uncultured Muriicola sp.]|uniref:DUF6327 family protein n=1 Tax=uncultured Muriicola sp. TaxID=1583102 RepID=UPI0026195C40|nr:DUF6327 family protein [uncultured Muriicola sp.]
MEIQYHSFSEIEERLRILKLRREIDKESLKLHLNQAKANFYPIHLMGGVSGIVQKIALTFAIKKLSQLFRKKFIDKHEKQISRGME